MMARLAARRERHGEAPSPHLVEAVRGSRDAVLAAGPTSSPERHRIARDAAQVILSGLSFGHRAGHRRARVRAGARGGFLRAHGLDRRQDRHATFPNDDRSLDELARLCAPGVRRPRPSAPRAARCARTSGTSPPTAPIREPALDQGDRRARRAQLARRQRRVHGAGDHGPNPAAEIALQVAGRHVGVIGWELK
jgi:hypothetical protein